MKIKYLLAILPLLFLSHLLRGQGSVSGTISDGGGTLPGATIMLDSAKYGASTDLNGHFQLINIPFGTYQIKVSFIGYQDYIDTITVTEKPLSLGTVMLAAGEYLNEVVVEGSMRNSEAKAINMTKVSNTIVTVVAADGIGKLPDKNAAEAVQRIPSVSIERDQGEGRYISLRGTPHDWSASLINGDRLPVADENADSRTVAFDIFPAELIEFIVVSKALTPDIEGDAIGGSINFITKAAPLERTLAVNLGGGFNFQAQGPIVNSSILWGDRSKNKKFGYLIAGSLWNRSYATDNYEVIYGSNENQGLNRLELRDYVGTRRTIGTTASMEYKFTDQNRIYAKFIYGGMRDNEWNRKTMYNWFVGAGRTVRLQNIHDIMLNRMIGGEVGGNFKLNPKINLDVRFASYSNRFGYGNVPFDGDDNRNGYHVVQFERFNLTYEDLIYLDEAGNIITNPALAADEVKLIEDDHPTGGDDYDNIQPQIQQELRQEDFEFTTAYSEINETWERDPIVGQLDLTYQPNNQWKIKIGTKLRIKEGGRFYSLHEWIPDVTKKPQGYTLDQFETESLDEKGGFLQELGEPYQGTFMPFLTEDQYSSFLGQVGDTLRERVMDENNPSFAEFVGSRYTYQEHVYAAYGMAEFQINEQMMLLGGLRMEYTELDMQADSLGKIEVFFNPVTGLLETSKPVYGVSSGSKYVALLPMVQFKYSPNKKNNLRFAVTRTFRRPNFNESKPGDPFYSFTDLVRTFGNPDLKPTYAWNFDVAWEHYFGNIGMISGGAFYKAIQDHIFATTESSTDVAVGNSAIGIKSFQNAQALSHLAGAEFVFNRRFDFLPGFLSGFGINANYSYIWSRMEVPGRTFNQPLPRQAPHLFNVALFYEKHNLQARLAVNYKSAYLLELNLAATEINGVNQLINPDTDEYDTFYGSFTSMDLSISYKLNKHFSIYTEWNNLLNSPLRIYRGRIERPVQTEYYSIRGIIGVKFNL
jgi:TonB-dependent receptor